MTPIQGTTTGPEIQERGGHNRISYRIKYGKTAYAAMRKLFFVITLSSLFIRNFRCKQTTNKTLPEALVQKYISTLAK
jgi:hypothetical protein